LNGFNSGNSGIFIGKDINSAPTNLTGNIIANGTNVL
jgi:hypothetical protein